MAPIISILGGSGSSKSFGRRRGRFAPRVIAPTITSPSNGSSGNRKYGLTINSSSFIGEYGADTHSSTDWQIASDSNFNTIVHSVTGITTSKTSYTVNLSTNGTYYSRVRHKANNDTIISDWSPTVSFGSTDYYYWRVIIDIAGGSGGAGRWFESGTPRPGGSGGRAGVYLETPASYLTAPGTLAYNVGNPGSEGIQGGNAPGGSGYNRGGNGAYGSQNGPVWRAGSGSGGGSTGVSLNGTLILGAGGGGGGGGSDSNGQSAGGAGGVLSGSSTGASGSTGGAHDSNPGGAGGPAGGPAGQGGDASNGGSNNVGGAGGAGFGGGSRGNNASWNNGSGGGGGGSMVYSLDTTLGDYRLYSSSGGDGSSCKFRLYRAVDGAGAKSFTLVNTRNVSGNSSISISAI